MKKKSAVYRAGIILAAAIVVSTGVFLAFRSSGEEAASRVQALPEGFSFNPDPDYYTEKYRPQYHLSPETGNMSDPNGMVYFDGEYHQFYQSRGQWGHAVSKDLIHWEHLPLALTRDELGDIWSGSTVVDWNDTSGFFDGKAGLVAIFTHFKNGEQSQSIAYSADKGRTWTKYDGNPVIPNPKVKDFRDPKVFWYEPTERWVMVVSVDQKVWFYTSADLKAWEFASEFGLGHGSHAAVWECPDFFELPVDGTNEKKWLLTVSIGNNRITKGSKAQYFIGTFDGKSFKNDNSPATTLWTDHGKDYYAAVSYSDIPKEDGRRIWLGWMSSWRYPFAMPTGVWKGNMSIPRELRLRDIPGEGIRLVQEPIEELQSLRGEPIKLKKQTLKAGENLLEDVLGTSFELEAEFALNGAKQPFGIKFRKGGEQATVLTYDPAAEELVLDRKRSGESSFEPDFAESMRAPLQLREGKLKLRLFVDESTVEVFANDGEAVLSAIIFPDPTSNGLELFTEGGKVSLDKAVFYPMNTVWRYEDMDSGKPLRIVVNKSILHLDAGGKAELDATVAPLGAEQKINWTSRDESVAKVAADGDTSATVTAMKEGMTEIVATSGDGSVSYSLNIFVGGK